MPFETLPDNYITGSTHAFDPAVDTPMTVIPESYDWYWIAGAAEVACIIGGWYLFLAWRSGSLALYARGALHAVRRRK